MKLCERPGCNNRHRARGLCATHYNQQQPNRHKKVTATCDYCGGPTVRDARASRYIGTYCTLRCRDSARHRGERCELPDDHIARWIGKSCEWRAPKQERARFISGHCAECARWFIAQDHGSESLYCSRTCARRTAKRIRRAREHNAPGTYTQSDIVRLFVLFDKRCAYCRSAVVGLPDPEHVLPLSRGGRNDITNLLPSCRACNIDKADMTLDEWATSRVRRHLPALHTTVDTSDHRYRHLVLRTATRPSWRVRSAA